MPKRIGMPDGSVVEFPDDMTDEQISSILRAQPGEKPRMSDAAQEATAPFAGLHDSATGIGDAITLGFKDEILAGAAAPFRAGWNALTGKGFDLGAAYDTELANQRGIQNTAEERSPVATTVGQIAGGIASPSMSARAAPATIAGMAARTAGQGALTGGAYGFGSGEGLEDRVAGGAFGAGTGAAIGGIVGGVGGAIGKSMARRSATTSADLAEKVGDAYDALHNLPPYRPADTQTLITKMRNAAKSGRVGTKRNAAVFDAIDDMEQEFLTQGASPGVIEEWRKIINSDLVSDKSQRRAAIVVRDALDDFAQNTGAPEARAAFRQKIQLQKVEDAVKDAYDVAGRGSKDVGLHLKNKIGALLNADKKAMARGQPSQFDAPMRAQMEKIKETGNIEGFLRWLGKFSPDSGLGMLGHGLTAITGGTSASVQIPAAVGAYAAKKAGAGVTQNNVDALIRIINEDPDPMVSARARELLNALTKGGAIGVQ